jgi:hypothetical protein
MPRRVIWRSWSKFEADFELRRISHLPLQNNWVDGHKTNPRPGDIYLTTNGYDYRPGNFNKATLYAESYVYLRREYDLYTRNQRKWDHRFHFCPAYAQTPRSSLHRLGCFWKCEMPIFERISESKKIAHTFGMVLGHKKRKGTKTNNCDIGWFRHKIVEAGRGRSFRYYGTDWPKGDPNYGGSVYINGHRGSPLKFTDARELMHDCKFVFAVENCFHNVYSKNYLTEKIFHGFLSCSVPIYLGCWNIEKLIDPGLFIDLRKFDKDPRKAMAYCEKMSDTEYQGYIDRITEFMHGPAEEFSFDNRFVELDKALVQRYG